MGPWHGMAHGPSLLELRAGATQLHLAVSFFVPLPWFPWGGLTGLKKSQGSHFLGSLLGPKKCQHFALEKKSKHGKPSIVGP